MATVKRINCLHDSLATTHTAMSPLWSLVLQPTPVALSMIRTQQRRLLSAMCLILVHCRRVCDWMMPVFWYLTR